MHVRTPSVGTLGGLQAAPPVVAGPRRERSKPKPMMNGLKKSDEAVRPVRVANKGAHAPAEPPEERASTKGNPGSQSTRRTQCRASVPQAADRIRKAAERNRKERLTALFHHVTPEVLGAAYFALKKDAAAGIDGMTWARYGEGLDERLRDLHRRLHSGGAYRAPPVRRVEIPKPDGGTRPLGIAALEDKIVQKAVVDVILTPIYEVEFLGFSYGFRPGRGAHDALDALAFGIKRRKVKWIADADLRAYFDTIPRDWLIKFLEHRIGDRRVIRLIRKWLNAGVMDDGAWTDTGMGTPQGNIVSPLLANVFLHYVLDLWFHRKWRPGVSTGEAIIVRYADDIVVGFQHKRDAERYLRDVRERLARFGLSLHPDKTRLVEFGRLAEANGRGRGGGEAGTGRVVGVTGTRTQ
ncbi:MAG: reverse transcriptase domain-containing protein, partial [Rhodospirillales bacterium]|nr:reverse transcriptase domain-containing protein [Rhodospirillales bacterium]